MWGLQRCKVLAYGVILLALSVPGVYVGGWISDKLTARGQIDAPLIVAIAIMLSLTPLVVITPILDDMKWLLASLSVVSFGFGMLNGLPGTTLQLVVPNQLRGQIIAAYFLIGTMMSLGIGPTIVAFVSDTMLGGPSQIGVSLSIVSGITIVASAAMLNYCRAGFREAVTIAREWR